MDQEFPSSPSKRRRTMSPAEERSTANAPAEAAAPATTTDMPQKPEMLDGKETSRAAGFLDVLMEQVEAESSSPNVPSETSTLQPKENPRPPPQEHLQSSPPQAHTQDLPSKLPQDLALKPPQELSRVLSEEHARSSTSETKPANIDGVTVAQDGLPESKVEQSDATASSSVPTAREVTPVKPDPVPTPMAVEGIVQDVTMLEIPSENTAPPNADAEPREWETDSSPYESSDSDTSTDSDDSDEEADGEYSSLDPEELARILMQGDGGSDDEGGRGKEKGNATVRTANERPEEVIPKPDVEVTSDMQIEILGTVEATVENTVLLKAKTTGEYQVLESGSLLCLKDRSVIGVIAETIGRVEQPMYTIRFTNDAAIEEAGLASAGTTVYYVVPHSTFVFTQPLKGLKGSDASNFHDEEVGDDEMEFSDDEKEAEHKRQLKLKRQGRLGRDDGGRGGRGRGRGRGRGDYRESSLRQSSVASNSEPIPDGSSDGALNYDDEPGEYTPLQRPGHDQPSQMLPPMNNDRGHSHGRGRGRGDRGSRGGHRGRGGRGSFDSYNHQPHQPNQQQHPLPPPPVFNNQAQSFFQSQQTPQLNPQAPFQPFSPSPISPLPAQQFNFGQFPNFPLPPPPPPATHQNYGQQQNPAGQSTAQGWTGGWQQSNLNQTAAAQVQRHLSELMRMQQQGQGTGQQNSYGHGQQNGYGQGRP